ncbi:hypothetical protein [Phyllobacterium sp. YR531]|uniref:hypothetical protein n=1 Tax=Phyllobacterium sp. YR531 TaxID=1144343 RepID=UPI00026F8747|nr:hypothetical protein [Phyllobacterium sp. YR531]EJN02146.1 hypothetical protein PMI41_02897 [Phyllobacterium sp. YR531]
MDGAAFSEVRSLALPDIPEVAAMFWRMFKPANTELPKSIIEYFSELYLNPQNDRKITSQVHIRGDGVLTGFIGALPLKMTLGDIPLQAAICGPLMVEDHLGDPLAGARLLRAFLAGPQDLSLSETANETSRVMWSKLRGKVLPAYSLEWVRVLRPAAFAADMASQRFGFLRYGKMLSGPFDMFAHRLMKTGTPELPQRITDSSVDQEGMASLITSCLKQYALRPDWETSTLKSILQVANSKSAYGTVHCRMVQNRAGVPLGAYIFHGNLGETVRVLQIIALKGHEGVIIDSLLSYAYSIGAIAVRARSQPRLMEAMMIRRGIFFQRSSTVVHARDPSILEAFSRGEAFFNGLAGEGWNRLNGDEFL